MKMKCFTAEDILKLQNELIRDLCIWDWLAEKDIDAARLAIYVQGVNDMTTKLLEKMEAADEQ